MKILEYKVINKGSILGSMNIQLEEWEGIIIRDVLLFQKDGKRWLNFPSRSYEKDGKTEYFHYIRFEDKNKHDEWQKKALKALQDYVNQARSQNHSTQPSQTHQGQVKGTHFEPPSVTHLTPAREGMSVTGEELPF